MNYNTTLESTRNTNSGIYQSCLQPVHRFDPSMFSGLDLESGFNAATTTFCPELQKPEIHRQIPHFAELLYLWRSSPHDQNDWIGYFAGSLQETPEDLFPEEFEIEALLEKNEIRSGSRINSNLGIASQSESTHPGINSYILSMFADLQEEIPGDYFELKKSFTAETLIMRKATFYQFMVWVYRFIEFSFEKMKSAEFLIQNPEKGIEAVVNSLFIIWYLKKNCTIYDLTSRTSYVGGRYETQTSQIQVSLGCVSYNRQADQNLLEASRTGRIASGRFVEELEHKFAVKLNVKHAIAVCNGTLADAVALSAIALKTGLNNVIVPSLTFIAQANAIRHAGLNPIFLDVGTDGLMEDVVNLAERNPAILYPVHLMGKVCRWVSQLQGTLPVLEDACEALGSQVDGRYAGTMGMAGTFSMYVSHSFTSGEGGRIATNDDEIAELCRSIRAHGRMGDNVNERFCFSRLGFNAKMSNIQAAYATAHIDDFDEIIDSRKQVVKQLADRLGDDFGVATNDIVAHGFPIRYPDQKSRDHALEEISKSGVECRPLFSNIAREHFGTKSDFPNAEAISSQYLYVPCHQRIGEKDIERICGSVLSSRNL